VRISALFLSVFLFSGPIMANNETQVYGYVEKAMLVDKKIVLSAKLDTGAKTASLNATNITKVEKDGVSYLQFTIPTKTGSYLMEGEYIGQVKIKVRDKEINSSSAKATPIKRPVVMLRIQLGNKIKKIRVNLTNRKRFLYALLLGRDAIIAFQGAVNPALVFTLKSERQ
jgi:hypothetical protein